MISTEVAIRRVIEKTFVTAVVEDILKAGFLFQEDEEGETTDNKQKILDLLFDLDDALVHVISIEDGQDGLNVENHEGWIRFVFGNDGFDVISDYTLNLDSLLRHALDM